MRMCERRDSLYVYVKKRREHICAWESVCACVKDKRVFVYIFERESMYVCEKGETGHVKAKRECIYLQKH